MIDAPPFAILAVICTREKHRSNALDRRCLCFVVDSGGSTIPEGFEPIDIVDLEPVFQLVKGIALAQDKQSIYDDVDVVKIGDFGLVKIPESNLTSLLSELKGSLNDPDLINVGFGNYEMRHETFALTRLCYYILTGKTNIDRQKDGTIKAFWEKGTNPDKSKRFSSVDELKRAIKSITDDNK